MLALLDASRQEIPEYVEERAPDRGGGGCASSDASRGRSRCGSPTTSRRSIAAYKQFDVLLVNAVMDGLNLVAKEAPVVNGRAGVVALSVNAGAFEELGEWVVPVDPLDVAGTGGCTRGCARARRATSGAPAWRRSGSTSREHDLEHWIDAQLADLDRASTIAAADERPLACRRVRRRAHGRRRRASRCRGAGRSRARRCGWRRRPRNGSAICRRATRSTTAQLAGIMAAKRTSDLIPLCHPLPLSLVERLARGRRRRRRDHRRGRDDRADGVEMEALVAASVAALTVYDMAKAIDKGMVDRRGRRSSRRRRRPA